VKQNKVQLDLIINCKHIILVLILFLQSCNNTANKKIVNQTNRDIDNTIVYKRWLKDTLNHINKSKETYKVYKDSLALDIFKKYDTIFNSSILKTNSSNKDIALACKLIKENNDVILDKTRLKLEVIHSYSLSPIKRKYDYEFEILKFIVSNGDKSFSYKYIKGNLINKTRSPKTPDFGADK